MEHHLKGLQSRPRGNNTPGEKRCLRDLGKLLLCALMEETKNWEHSAAVVKGDGESGREMGMRSCRPHCAIEGEASAHRP